MELQWPPRRLGGWWRRVLSSRVYLSGRSWLAGNAVWAWGREVGADASQAALLPLPQTAEGGPQTQPAVPRDQARWVGVLGGGAGAAWGTLAQSQGPGFDSPPLRHGDPGPWTLDPGVWGSGLGAVLLWPGTMGTRTVLSRPPSLLGGQACQARLRVWRTPTPHTSSNRGSLGAWAHGAS